MTTIPIGNPGLAGGVVTENFKKFEVLLSDRPAIFGEEVEVAAAYTGTLALYSVVKLDAAGRITGLADNVSGANAAGAKGILAMQIVKTGAGTPKAYIYRGGHFNIDALVWDDTTFDTDAKKIAAFRDAPTPSAMVLGFNRYHRKT